MNLYQNYTKIYFRRFRKETGHYLVNIFGLALGFTILFFILMFVRDENQIDGYHSKKDRIYRIIEKSQEEDGLHHYASVANPFGKILPEEFPGIEKTARMVYFGSSVLVNGETRLANRSWALVDREIFDILDFDIHVGNPNQDFEGNVGLVLSKQMATKLFGDENPVGLVLEEDRFGDGIEVLAVIDDMPINSTYRFDALYVAKFDQFSEGFQRFFASWDNHFMTTWVLMKEGASLEEIYDQKEAFLEKYLEEDIREEHDFYFQPIAEIHLGSTHIETLGMEPLKSTQYSDHSFVSMILLMGFLVIFIAALNYVNLSSVQALKRTLEASMRKINGAGNKHLIAQLFFETFLTIIIAYAFALLLILILFPYFQSIANKEFGLIALFSADFIPYHMISVLSIWLVSALLPALYYSKLKRSLLVLKNAFSGKGDMLRKVLVGIQYALSIFLIIGSMVIYRQLNYVQSKDLGFDQENMIVLDINSGAARNNFKNIIAGIKKNANVINASTSSRVPGEWKDIPTANLSLSLANEPVQASHYAIDLHWLDTYQIDLLEGSNFTGADDSDSLYVLVNKKAVEMLGLEDPVGTSIYVNDNDTVKLRIAGVVEDFHFQSLYEPIGPAVFTNWNNHVRSIDYFTIRYSGDPKVAVEHVEAVNAEFDPETPAEIHFLDQQWERFYEAEESRATIILIASIVSIIISAFGLFGLINFTVERKTKEIGIRKVMGANVTNIIRLILKDYLVLLVLSLLLAAPISWWLFQDWLADFAYRINLSADLFIIAFVAVLVISFTTVLARIFKIAKANPVTAIRYE